MAHMLGPPCDATNELHQTIKTTNMTQHRNIDQNTRMPHATQHEEVRGAFTLWEYTT